MTSLDALLSTTYGWSLVGKLVLLGGTGIAGLLGLRALRRLRPSLGLLRVEAAMALGISPQHRLLLASAPARGPQFAPQPADRGHATGLGACRRPARRPLRRTQPTRAEFRHHDRPRHAPALAGPRAPRDDHVLARTLASVGAGDPARRHALAGRGDAAVGLRRLAHRGRGRAQRTAVCHVATAWTVGSPLGAASAHRARHSQRALEPITTPLALVLAALACALAIWRARARLIVRRPRTA